MISYHEGVTDWEHFVNTIIENSSLKISYENCSKFMEQTLKRVIEVYKDGKLSGYALIMDIGGDISFHGYKLIPGNSFTAFKIARNILKEYPNAKIYTTHDKYLVRRLGLMLKFKELILKRGLVCLER